jgi:hypothetical protein
VSGPAGEVDAGLCARCGFAAAQHNRKGSAFWRCRRADGDPSFRRYPPLPVTRCEGFEEGVPSVPFAAEES